MKMETESIQLVRASDTMMDEDTGDKYTVTVSNPSHAPDDVKITFGKSFSIQLDYCDADALAEAIRRACEAAQANIGVEMEEG